MANYYNIIKSERHLKTHYMGRVEDYLVHFQIKRAVKHRPTAHFEVKPDLPNKYWK